MNFAVYTFFFFPVIIINQAEPDRNTEEYPPNISPTKMGSVKSLIAATPMMYSISTAKKDVRVEITVRLKVWVTLELISKAGPAFGIRSLFSRMRSNIIIVAFIE